MSGHYEVKVCDKFGRYLVASRDLKAREVIIKEEPIVIGPTDDPKGIPMCLGCCLKMTDNQFSRCSKCHFPVCSISCEKESQHEQNECQIFVRNQVVYPPINWKNLLNKSIIILRCLLLKERDAEQWNKLMSMSDNRESRRNKPNCIRADERILENFRRFFPDAEFDVDEVLKLSGIIDVNAHAYPIREPVSGRIVAKKCHIYQKTSLIAHSCSPNASWAAEDPRAKTSTELVIRTNVPLSQGEMITVAYDDSDLLYGTLRRLLPMEISGMFICKCKRCLDPTELGTYLSALKCPECPEGFLLSLCPTDSFSEWKCDSCDKIYSEVDVLEIIEDAESVVEFPKEQEALGEQEDEDVAYLKEYVEDYSGTVLHPNHYIIQEVNFRIIKSLCFSLEHLSDEDLKDYLERCRNLLAISNVLTPGFCEFRAFLQYHFCRGLLQWQERRCGTGRHYSAPLTEIVETYKLILKLQQEVLMFLEEKFISSKRIDYIWETMQFVKEQIKRLECSGASGKDRQPKSSACQPPHTTRSMIKTEN